MTKAKAHKSERDRERERKKVLSESWKKKESIL